MTEREIFLAALQKPTAGERAALLDSECGTDVNLRDHIEALLAEHEQLGSYLESPVATSPRTVDGLPAAERPGTVIGPYKLLQLIGEGGFGVVFLAEQTQPVRRKVALKVLKPGMDARQVVARFEAERQALAIMDHPHIAKVLDGGATATGRPYFVMELVKGVPITDFCDRNHLTPRQRLEQFISVCQAVQHAHQKGIIHRDLKPSNVLVSRHDTTSVVKVIDFGVAKALGQQLTDKTLFTGLAQMVGTPLYMSPEQAGMSDLDADTRSDIYSLGVLLYELLTGTTPFEKERLRTAGYDEIRRIIREEEPPRPSTRFTTQGQLASTVSANRKSDPKQLRQLLRGELDWIVMKALEKDRSRRYESASAFAADVERYLKDEPVLACPPSALYRFRKFARRYKAALATASAIGLALLIAVAALATSTVWITRAWQSETEARDDLREALERQRIESYFHRIALAHSELSVHNLRRALELLDECPEYLRDWEWHYLRRLCFVNPVTLQGRGQGIRGVAFSPDGQRLAAANEDGTIGLFNPQTGAEFPPLTGHTNQVRSVAFHPLSNRLASISTDRTVKVWDLTTGRVLFDRSGDAGSHSTGHYGVAFSPDGRRLAAGDADGSVVLYDAATGRELSRLPGHEQMVLCVEFSPDGRLLATGSWAGVLRVWDTETHALRARREGDGRPLSAARFSPDGRCLATTGYDRLVRLWDVVKLLDAANRDEPRAWRGHDCIILGLAFSADGKRLATMGGEDRTVKLWEPMTGREILKLRGHSFLGICLAFSRDGQRLASTGLDGRICIWDATPATQGQELWTRRHDDEVWSVAFSPDGKRIASCSFDKTVRLWDATTGTELHRLRLSSQGTLLAFSRDGEHLAAVSRDKTARIWDTVTGKCLSVVTTPNDHLLGVTFSPDGQHLLVDEVGRKDGKVVTHAVTAWKVQPGQDEPNVVGVVGRHAHDVWCLKFSPDGKLLATASNDGTLKIWRWDPEGLGQPHAPLRTFAVRNYGFGDCVAFTPNGERVVAAAGDTVKIWDVNTGTELPAVHGHSGDIVAVALSPDGRWLATAGEDTTIALWDAASLSGVVAGSPKPPRHILRGHSSMVMSLAFDRDSQRLVSGSRDKTVMVWDVTRFGR